MPAMVVTLFAMVMYGWYTNKNVKAKVEGAKKETEQKAEEIARQATQEAISAMQTHIKHTARKDERLRRRKHTNKA